MPNLPKHTTQNKESTKKESSLIPDPLLDRPQRYSTKESAQIEIYGRSGKILCKLENLSGSGAFLEMLNATYIPRSGDLVRLTVMLRQLDKTHVVDAEIIWAQGLGLGVSFLKKRKLFEKLSNRLTIT